MTRPDRPVIGGEGNRPGIAERPNIGVGNVNRPVIGGNNNVNINRPIVGGNNINVNRPVIGSGNINNRPGWGIDPGFSRPHWGNYWQNNCIRPNYHGWYHGCWHGHWSNYWYVPLAIGGTVWSLNAFTSSWGYGPTYYNPYYEAAPSAVVAPYDYSQPVTINNYVSSDSSAESPDDTAEPPFSEPAVSTFDQARTAFKQGDYSSALAKVNESIKQDDKDPVMHEFRALCLFAKGDYQQAAAALNSLLASAPGMDWTTISGLYGDVDDYSKQLRQLEDFCRDNKDNAAGRFVLAYHYLVLGHSDQAIDLLKRVIELQPQDKTAQRMLASLEPPKQEVEPPAPAPDADAAQTDLVGNWKAKAGESTIELAITEDSKFTWKATMPNQPVKEIQGNVSASADSLSLETEKAGSMIGKVKSGGADKFTFQMQGMLPGEPGLIFERVK
jgi:tetratricopeptide (TPR) repeat protein